MKFVIDGLYEEFVLETTGRKFYANSHVIGISHDGDWVHYGADGGVGPKDEFTTEERAELANHMIALWTRFKS